MLNKLFWSTPIPYDCLFDEKAARAYFEKAFWPDGPICPHCGGMEKAYRMEGKTARAGLWKCRRCRKEFSVTVGTIFEASHLPLHKWLFTLYLLKLNNGEINIMHLQRTIGATYKATWWMVTHLREGMKYEGVVLPKLPYKERVKNQGGV